MARTFTAEELEEIRNSSEFKDYMEKAGEDETNLALTHYLQNEKNNALWVQRFSAASQTNSSEIADIPDLSQLVLHMRNNSMTASILEELRNEIDPNDARSLDILNKVIEAYRSGKDIDKLNDLIQTADDAALAEKIAQEVEYDNALNVPRIKKEIVVPGLAKKPRDNNSHIEARTIPDLSRLILHMRGANDSMTEQILQERLDDIRANHPDDKRAIEIYEAVIAAYRTGKDIDKLNDMIKTEADAAIAEDIAQQVEYDNAYDVPRIKKELIVPGPGPQPAPGPHPDWIPPGIRPPAPPRSGTRRGRRGRRRRPSPPPPAWSSPPPGFAGS